MSRALDFLNVTDAELAAYEGKWVAWAGEVIDSSDNDADELQAMLDRLRDRDYVLSRVRRRSVP